jgi:hypothetical protein
MNTGSVVDAQLAGLAVPAAGGYWYYEFMHPV